VSIAPESLGDGVRALAAAAHGVPGIHALKCGLRLGGVVRSDKLIAHCDSLEALHKVATGVRTRLDGVAAQGVPFTASIGADGLLSWGMDPPDTLSMRHESWRSWITERLAEYVIEGRQGTQDDPEPWRYAIERIALDGVNTQTWAPEDGLFGRPPAAL